MNFRIIENNEDYYEKYDEWCKGYNKGELIKNLNQRLGIGHKKYREYRTRALKEKKIKDRRKSKKPKYYYKTLSGKYAVNKRHPITKKMIYYGTVNTEKEAKELVKKLKKNGWGY